MTAIVLIEHNGTLKNVKTKELTRETLYKKCGLRSAEHFEKTTTWEIEHNKEMFCIELWAKTEGKANNENKYDFPPPVDNSLYFGTCALIRVDNKGGLLNLTCEIWLKLYEKLFGGFEDLDEDGDEEDEDDIGEDADEEDDEEEIVISKPVKKNKKKAFIPDEEEGDGGDGDGDGEEDEDGEGDDEEDERITTGKNGKGKVKCPVVNESEEEAEEDYYGSELEEEAYSYSDEE
jgi:hypothetical protein